MVQSISYMTGVPRGAGGRLVHGVYSGVYHIDVSQLLCVYCIVLASSAC